MTPNPTPPNRTSSGFALGLTLGLGVASVIALIGAAVAFGVIKRKEVDVRKGWNLVPVVVAAQDISADTTVTMEMISQRSVPEQFVTASVVKPDSASYIVNQKLLVPVQAGDLLLWSQFETTKAAERVSSKIPADQRLYGVKVSPASAAGGWIRPADHVDVIAVFLAPDSKEMTSMTVLESAEVFSTGRILPTTNLNMVAEADRAFDVVSFLVSDEQAHRLALYESLGTLKLTLRNETDAHVQGHRRFTFQNAATK